MPSSEQFCLRWNNHQSTLASVFSDLLENTELTDVTLSAEGQTLHAHRLVLAACSPYFKEIFDKCSDRSPILIIKGAKFEELKALVSFMYCGEINVEQEDLVSLLSTAESLSIKGLADNSVKHAAPVPPTPPATTSSTPSQPPMPPLTTLSPAPSAAGINHAFFRRFTELVNQNPIAAAAAAFNHHAVPPFVDGPTPPPAHSSSIAPLRPDPSTPPPVIAGANKRKRRPLSPHLFSGPQNLSDHNRSHSPSSPAPSVKILKEERALSPLVSHPSPEANNNVPTIMNNNKLTLVPSRSSSGMTDELPLSSGEEHSSAGSVGGGRGSHEEAGLKSGDEDMEEEEEEDDVVEEEMRKRGITRSMEDLLDRQWPDEDDEGYQENRGSKPEIKQEDLKPGELGKHQCVKCGRYYAHKSSLWRHSTYECMKPKQFVCTFCGKTFKQKNTVKLHMLRSHNVDSWRTIATVGDILGNNMMGAVNGSARDSDSGPGDGSASREVQTAPEGLAH